VTTGAIATTAANRWPTTAQPTAAQPTDAQPFDPVAVRSHRRWYGWQVLLVDLGALAFSAAALAADSRALVYTAGAVQFFGPPIVHWTHGRVGAGFGSMGMRLALPLLGAFVGYGTTECTVRYSSYGYASGEDCSDQSTALVIGLAAGQIIASVLDIAALSYETDSVATARRAPRGPQWSASIVPTPHGLQLGVGGSF